MYKLTATNSRALPKDFSLMLMIYRKRQHILSQVNEQCDCQPSKRFPSQRCRGWCVKMTDCHDKLSLCYWLSAESILIYVPVLLPLWSSCFLQLTVKKRGAVKTHGWPTQIRSISSTQPSLLQLFARKRIMNDSEWWNRRSLQSSHSCFKKPKCGPSMHQEHYLLKTCRLNSAFNTQRHSDLTRGWEDRWDHSRQPKHVNIFLLV